MLEIEVKERPKVRVQRDGSPKTINHFHRWKLSRVKAKRLVARLAALYFSATKPVASVTPMEGFANRASSCLIITHKFSLHGIISSLQLCH